MAKKLEMYIDNRIVFGKHCWKGTAVHISLRIRADASNLIFHDAHGTGNLRCGVKDERLLVIQRVVGIP